MYRGTHRGRCVVRSGCICSHECGPGRAGTCTRNDAGQPTAASGATPDCLFIHRAQDCVHGQLPGWGSQAAFSSKQCKLSCASILFFVFHSFKALLTWSDNLGCWHLPRLLSQPNGSGGTMLVWKVLHLLYLSSLLCIFYENCAVWRGNATILTSKEFAVFNFYIVYLTKRDGETASFFWNVALSG